MSKKDKFCYSDMRTVECTNCVFWALMDANSDTEKYSKIRKSSAKLCSRTKLQPQPLI